MTENLSTSEAFASPPDSLPVEVPADRAEIANAFSTMLASARNNIFTKEDLALRKAREDAKHNWDLKQGHRRSEARTALIIAIGSQLIKSEARGSPTFVYGGSPKKFEKDGWTDHKPEWFVFDDASDMEYIRAKVEEGSESTCRLIQEDGNWFLNCEVIPREIVPQETVVE